MCCNQLGRPCCPSQADTWLQPQTADKYTPKPGVPGRVASVQGPGYTGETRGNPSVAAGPREPLLKLSTPLSCGAHRFALATQQSGCVSSDTACGGGHVKALSACQFTMHVTYTPVPYSEHQQQPQDIFCRCFPYLSCTEMQLPCNAAGKLAHHMAYFEGT